MTLSLVNWNLERRGPQSRQASVMLRRILAQSPGVACLTEAHEGSTASLGGYEIADRGAAWSSERRDTERLVVIWSAMPWHGVDTTGNAGTKAGGYVSGLTETAIGVVRVIGVCAPHHAASPIEAVIRARQWTEQTAFWEGLAELIEGRGEPTIVLGDFNQFVPRIWGSKTAHGAMMSALEGLTVATGGVIAGVDAPTIDHVAHSPDLAASAVSGLSRFGEDGRALSDHFGVVAKLEWARRS